MSFLKRYFLPMLKASYCPSYLLRAAYYNARDLFSPITNALTSYMGMYVGFATIANQSPWLRPRQGHTTEDLMDQSL